MYQSKMVIELRGDDIGGCVVDCGGDAASPRFIHQVPARSSRVISWPWCSCANMTSLFTSSLAQLVMCQENEVARGQVRSFFGCGGASRVFQGSCRAFSCIFINKHTKKQSHGASGVISSLFFFANLAI